MGEMQKTNYKLCKSCMYSMYLTEFAYACGYIDKTKQRRNCPIGWCDKYEKKKPKRRRLMKRHG